VVHQHHGLRPTGTPADLSLERGRRATDGALALATSSPAIRVVLADDRTVARGGLRVLLEEETDIDVIRGGGDLEAVAHEVGEHCPDVLVLDLATPDQSAVAAIGRLRSHAPDTQIVVLASEREAASAMSLLDAGALGFVAREAIEHDLSPAVHAAARGERYVSARIEPGLRNGPRPRGDDRLTTRETEVLGLIVLGHTSVEVAKALHLSPRTVETHRARIHKKLELATRAELVRYALRRGLLRA
jgi:two-component system response regulator NreC